MAEPKYITYTHKYHKGIGCGDFAFEWDLDDSERAKWHEYVEQCKKDGTYGQEESVQITLMYLPEYDDPQVPTPKTENYRMIVLDLSKYGNS